MKDGDAEFDRIFWQERPGLLHRFKVLKKTQDAEEVVQKCS